MALHANPVGVPHAGFGGGGVAALVLIVDPGAKPRIDPEQVAAALGLTKAESRVAAALAGGATVRDIARDTYRAEAPCAGRFKRVHAKLDISRQADLVRMVLSLLVGPALSAESGERGSHAKTSSPRG